MSQKKEPTTLTIYVKDMDCPVERAQIEKAFSKIKDIEALRFDMTLRHVIVQTRRPEIEPTLLTAIHQLGYDARPSREGELKKPGVDSGFPKKLLLALACAILCEFGETFFNFPHIAVLLLGIATLALAGASTLTKGLKALSHLHFTMNALMTVAVIGALLIDEIPEAAMVMTLFEIGEAIEKKSQEKARFTIRRLIGNDTRFATVKTDRGWQKIPVNALQIGHVLQVKPGERICADGQLESDAALIDESMLTGEANPVTKTKGEAVYSGTLSVDSVLVVRITKKAEDSTANRILALIEEAQNNKAPVERFIDRFAAVYTPAVFALALLVALFGIAFSNAPFQTWLYRALAVLVIACPCALVISTPIAIVSSLTNAARRGILAKGGLFLEKARTIRHVVFDKTGTLTRGTPRLTGFKLFFGIEEKEALTLAHSLATLSTHPISHALQAALSQKGLRTKSVFNLKNIPGYGLSGIVAGSVIHLTNEAWLEKHGKMAQEPRDYFFEAKRKGLTTVALSDFFGIIAIFSFADELKNNVRESIQSLKSSGVTPHLLTGDTKETAKEIASLCAIDNVRSRATPQEKLAYVETLDKEAPTAMVGDGINDAPALARASIGFAMGKMGSDSALEASDVTLINDDISSIAYFKRLSQAAYRTIVTNVTFALAVKALFIVLALLGKASMWMAVFADTGVCLIVVAWSLRLIRLKIRLPNSKS